MFLILDLICKAGLRLYILYFTIKSSGRINEGQDDTSQDSLPDSSRPLPGSKHTIKFEVSNKFKKLPICLELCMYIVYIYCINL